VTSWKKLKNISPKKIQLSRLQISSWGKSSKDYYYVLRLWPLDSNSTYDR